MLSTNILNQTRNSQIIFIELKKKKRLTTVCICKRKSSINPNNAVFMCTMPVLHDVPCADSWHWSPVETATEHGHKSQVY